MDQVLRDFLRALRAAGVKVSIPEAIDAAKTLGLVGYGDREVFKDALSVVLAKSLVEQEAFDVCFDRFFSLGRLGEDLCDTAFPPPVPTHEEGPPLAEMMLQRDGVGIAASLMEAAREVGIPQIRFPSQKGRYMGNLLRHMGLEDLQQEILQLRQEGTASARGRAEELARAEKRLLEETRDFMDRQLQLYGRVEEEELFERRLKQIRLSDLEQRDFHRMHLVIQRMVRRLSDVHSRRRKAFRRGQLDFRRTLRRNITYDGLLVDLQWRRRKVDRPDIVALCDVSSSVSSVARFLLLFLYSLNRRLARIRTFTFCSNLVEVSHVFDEFAVEEALVRLKRGIGLGILMGPTDYGQAFRDFQRDYADLVTHKTTLLILGDARNNFSDPETGILRSLHQRSKRLLWLNPEPPSLWRTGDSEMRRYLPYCQVARECSTVGHLERVVDDLLRVP